MNEEEMKLRDILRKKAKVKVIGAWISEDSFGNKIVRIETGRETLRCFDSICGCVRHAVLEAMPGMVIKHEDACPLPEMPMADQKYDGIEFSYMLNPKRVGTMTPEQKQKVEEIRKVIVEATRTLDDECVKFYEVSTNTSAEHKRKCLMCYDGILIAKKGLSLIGEWLADLVQLDEDDE